MVDDGTVVACLQRLRSWDVQVYRGRRGSLHIHSELGNVSLVPEHIALADDTVRIEGKAEGYTPVTLTFKRPEDDGSAASWTENMRIN